MGATLINLAMWPRSKSFPTVGLIKPLNLLRQSVSGYPAAAREGDQAHQDGPRVIRLPWARRRQLAPPVKQVFRDA